MIHHLFTLHRPGSPVAEKIDTTPQRAVMEYARDVYPEPRRAQLTVAVWKDGAWLGYFKAALQASFDRVEPITTPECFEPLPCPKVTPAVTAPTFAKCEPFAQQVAFMALESRARSLGLEAEEHRSVGHNELADVLVGQQGACIAALDVLKGASR